MSNIGRYIYIHIYIVIFEYCKLSPIPIQTSRAKYGELYVDRPLVSHGEQELFLQC